MAKAPQPLSPGEEAFALHCRIESLEPVREYVFLQDRKFRFDFAFPEKKIGIEIEGATQYGKSRHSRGDGFESDCEKYNLAAAAGWRVFRFTTKMVMSLEAMNFVLQALK